MEQTHVPHLILSVWNMLQSKNYLSKTLQNATNNRETKVYNFTLYGDSSSKDEFEN